MLTRKQFQAVLPAGVDRNNHKMRKSQGWATLAYRSDDRDDAFDLLDPVAIRLTEKLARRRFTLAEADRITSDTWPMWSDAVSLAETYPAGEQPLSEHVFLVIADIGDSYASRIGGLASVVKDLPADTKVIHAISIDRLIRELRADAKKAGVDLPDKLTPAFGSPEYLQWRETIDEPWQIEAKRDWIAKAKGSD